MAIILPTPGGDIGTWGHKVNDALTTLDTTDKALAASVVAEAQARGTEIFNHATAEAQARGEAISAAVRAEALGRTVQLETHSVEEVAARGAAISDGIAASRPILYGTGFPNGAISAPVGTLYADKAVTNGASLWQKIWGIGVTGWTVVAGDTGRRNISSLVDPEKVDTTKPYSYLVQRNATTATIQFSGVPRVTGVPLVAVPPGFEVAAAVGVGAIQEGPLTAGVIVTHQGGWIIPYYSHTSGRLYITITGTPREAWPMTTLPGTN